MANLLYCYEYVSFREMKSLRIPYLPIYLFVIGRWNKESMHGRNSVVALETCERIGKRKKEFCWEEGKKEVSKGTNFIFKSPS